MKVVWESIQEALIRKGYQLDRIQDMKAIYNSASFQNYVTYNEGVITDRTKLTYSSLSPLINSEDLSKEDPYNLDIFLLTNRDISYSQASSITPSQIEGLAVNQQEIIKRALLGGGVSQGELAFLYSPIIQTGFPYKKITGNQYFHKRNGNLSVTMSAPPDIGLPFGLYPRLLFIYICSHVVRTKSRYIRLGHPLLTLSRKN